MTADRFVVPGAPVPKARARVTRGGHAFTPKRTADAELLVRQHAKQAGVQRRVGPVRLTICFYEADRRRRDLDNMAKLVQDALNPSRKDPWGAWQDDAQIVSLIVHRAYAPESPHTYIEIADALDANPAAERAGMGES